MEYRFYKVKNTIISLLLISVEVIFVNSASSAGKRYLGTDVTKERKKKTVRIFTLSLLPNILD